MSLNNQFYEHPLIENTLTTLGSGVTLVKDAATAGVDYLLVPPPAASPVGDQSVSRLLRAVTVVNTTGAEIPEPSEGETNLLIVYKTAAEEIIIPVSFETSIFDPGQARTNAINTPFLVRPTDRGIFLRVTAEGITGLTAHCTFDDIRRIDQVVTSLTDTPQTVLSGRLNTVRKVPLAGEEFEHRFMTIANADSVPHIVDVSLFDGTDTVLLASVACDEGVCTELFDNVDPPSLLSGWSLIAVLQEAIETGPCYLLAGYTDVNLHPVRQDQGGAY
jgi:hypothetical protein